jgi:V/A-type H+-transporting ATPase subunit G/H
MKSEVLKNIKTAEEEYQSLLSTVMAEKRRRLSDAELEADNLVMKASASAEEYKKLKYEEIRQQAERKRTEIMMEGDRKAADLKAKGSKNFDKAVNLLVARFRERMNVST